MQKKYLMIGQKEKHVLNQSEKIKKIAAHTYLADPYNTTKDGTKTNFLAHRLRIWWIQYHKRGEEKNNFLAHTYLVDTIIKKTELKKNYYFLDHTYLLDTIPQKTGRENNFLAHTYLVDTIPQKTEQKIRFGSNIFGGFNTTKDGTKIISWLIGYIFGGFNTRKDGKRK